MTSNQQPTQLYEIEIEYATRDHHTVVEGPTLEGVDQSQVPNVVIEFARLIARTGAAGPQTFWRIRIGATELVKLGANGVESIASTMFIWEGH
jgi:hypothetical protein